MNQGHRQRAHENTFFALKMNGMQQVYSCQNQLALKRAESCRQGSVLSVRLENKHLAVKHIFHYNIYLTCVLLSQAFFSLV